MSDNVVRPLLKDQQLYFIHVPKCAGTSFISLIDERYVFDEIIPIHHETKQLKNNITDQQLAQYKFIRGHFPYDLVVPRLKIKPRIITFLRDPVTRFISNFNMRQRISGPLVATHNALANISLDELLARPDLLNVTANDATRLIGGFSKTQDGEIVPNLERAKERLKDFDFIGIVERFNDSLDLFSHVFDFPPIRTERNLNISPNREARLNISEETLNHIAEVEWADMELYKLGLELFNNHFSRSQEDKKSGIRYPQIIKRQHIQDDLSLVDPGAGWQVAERNPRYGILRWSGPETVSFLRYPLAPNFDYALRFQVHRFLDRNILESLKVRVNGVNIEITKRMSWKLHGVIFKGFISKDVINLSEDYTHISFEVNRTSSPGARTADHPDERLLGLCYHQLSLEAV